MNECVLNGRCYSDGFADGYNHGRADTINELMVELYPCRYVYDDDCMKCSLRGTCKIEYFENELDKLKEKEVSR